MGCLCLFANTARARGEYPSERLATQEPFREFLPQLHRDLPLRKRRRACVGRTVRCEESTMSYGYRRGGFFCRGTGRYSTPPACMRTGWGYSAINCKTSFGMSVLTGSPSSLASDAEIG